MDMLPPGYVETLRDRQGHVMGSVERQGSIILLRDRRGHLVGSFDGTVTRDRVGHMVGYGNQLSCLVLHGR